jgi:LysM repeat protein
VRDPIEPAYAPAVRRRRLGSIAVVSMALPIIAAACGDDGDTAGTLPPLLTTTTTTTVVVTTTTVITYYVVQGGDTLSKIAARFGVDQAELMAANGITNPDHIEKGQELKIPPPKQVLETLPTTTAPASTTPP